VENIDANLLTKIFKEYMNKTCYRCHEIKALEEFSKARGMKDGLQAYCKSCQKEYHAKYLQTTVGKAAQSKSAARMRIKHPLEKQARNKVMIEIVAGRLIRPDICSVEACSNIKVEAHHHLGYREEHWLDVEWLCTKHHREADRREEAGS
jgi:hypothetical protein